MAEPVTLAAMKVHLRLSPGATPEDDYVAGLIVTARRAVEHRTGRTIVATEPTLTGDDLEAASHAIKLLVATWYHNREGDAPEPMQVGWLLGPITQWEDGECAAE